MKKDEPWRNYVKSIIRDYSKIKKEFELFNFETIVEKSELEKKKRRMDAVEEAILTTKQIHPKDWEARIKLINMVYWTKEKTIAGAAMEIPCHINTAGAWNVEFIRLVYHNLNLP